MGRQTAGVVLPRGRRAGGDAASFLLRYLDDPRWRGASTPRSVAAASTLERPPAAPARPQSAGARPTGDRRQKLKEAHASLENLMMDYGIDPAIGRPESPEVIRRPQTPKKKAATPRKKKKKAKFVETVDDKQSLAAEVDRLFKGEPMSVPGAVAPPQYGTTRRRWFQEVPPTEWFRHHHLIDPWVRYHTDGFGGPPSEPPPPTPTPKKKKKRKKVKKVPKSPPPEPEYLEYPEYPDYVEPAPAPPPFDALAARRKRRRALATILLQAVARGFLARCRARRLRQRLEAAKRASRRRREKEARRQHIRKLASVAIQAVWRGALARERYRGLRAAARRAAADRREQKLRSVIAATQKRLRLRACALLVARLRGWRDRKRFLASRDAADAARRRRDVENQKRSAAALERMRRTNGAVTIQRVGRGAVARREAARRRAARDRADRLRRGQEAARSRAAARLYKRAWAATLLATRRAVVDRPRVFADVDRPRVSPT